MADNNNLYSKLKANPLAFGILYTTNHFRDPSPKFHYSIVRESMNSKHLAVASPRESAKSTILTFLKTIHAICFKYKHFVVVVQNTYAKAAGSLGAVKKEIKENPDITRDFAIQITKDAEGDTVFRHPDGFETRVLCKGAEQIGSVRGEKFGAHRPDLIIVDDLEDDELVRSRERRDILKDEFDEALIPAGDIHTCQYIVIGTILHDDSLMSKLVSSERYKEYTKLFFKALNVKDGIDYSLWPEKWNLAKLYQMRADKPSVFAKEYQNDPVAFGMAKFKKVDFRYWRVEDNSYVLLNEAGFPIGKESLGNCRAAIACDLAWETKRESDFSVILAGFLTPFSDILIDSYIYKKGLRPHEIEEVVFSMEERLRRITGSSVYVGFEKAKLEKVIQHLLKEAMKVRNHYLIFKPLQWDGDKIQRIETRLEPRYAQHTIYHKSGMGELEHELVRFPTGVHDDLCDSLSGLVQLLQYPKGIKKPTPKEDEFEWWRSLVVNKNKRGTFMYGKRKRFEIPATRSFR